MLRIRFLISLGLVLCANFSNAGQPPGDSASGTAPLRVFLLEAKQLQASRLKVQQGDKTLLPAAVRLKEDARKALKTGPFSVMDKHFVPPSGDKHDYMSQAPYFWPNPATSNGLPYIRRDGERNPEIYKISDHRALWAQVHETM